MEEHKFKVSMITVVAYSNVHFNIQKLYDEIVHDTVDLPETKRKKIKTKTIKAPKGTILATRKGKDMKGIPSKLSKNGKEEFPNQTSIYISIGTKNIHFMIFRNSIKLSGCSSIQDAIDAITTFWDKIKGTDFYTLPEGKPTFIFSIVATNIDFNLDFNIDRHALDILMKSDKYEKYVNEDAVSNYESSTNTQVRIPLKLPKPQLIKYTQLVINGKKYDVSTIDKNYLNKKKDSEPLNRATFMVFRSGKVIQSTRLHDNVDNFYKIFIDIINSNKEEIKEKIEN